MYWASGGGLEQRGGGSFNFQLPMHGGGQSCLITGIGTHLNLIQSTTEVTPSTSKTFLAVAEKLGLCAIKMPISCIV